MNAYTYDSISIGQTEAFEICVSEHMISTFRDLTGDINPLHCDEAFAKERSADYRGKVCYGMLTASFLSTLAGVYLPGKYCLIHEVRLGFSKPVFVGDCLHIQGIVADKFDTFKQLLIKVKITNQRGEIVLKGKMKAGVFL